MEKRLSSFIHALAGAAVSGSADPVISSLAFDSRDVKPGALFFALPGTHTHGNAFIPEAVAAGARAVVYEGTLDAGAEKALSEAGRVALGVENSRSAMSPVAAEFFGHPSEELVVIGVTGTEGKSSTVAFLWQLLCCLGRKAGFISTVQYSSGGPATDNSQHQTTPEAPIVQGRLREMADAGCEFAVVEASSHGLSPRTNRLGDVSFDGAIMMNVTHEHLEFHGDWEQYRADKANLFRGLAAGGREKTIRGKRTHVPAFGLVNTDDPSAGYFALAAGGARVIGFGLGTAGKGRDTNLTNRDTNPTNICEEYAAEGIYASAEGISFRARSSGGKSFSVEAPLPGAFNVYNVLAAALAVSELTGLSPEIVAREARSLTPVKGRMTRIDCGQPFEALVDYAHTPSSFMAIFPPLRERAQGNIIAVFGSGGERDLAKRPEQGKIAARFCDIVILSDEDPRGEDPAALLSMIEAGCVAEGKRPGIDLFVIPDRREAIRRAFSLASPGDIVLLLGKSHENSIIYKDFVMPWDEIAEAKKALADTLIYSNLNH